MEKKNNPVEQGDLMIRLEFCRGGDRGCFGCPGENDENCMDRLAEDALAYICYLEEENLRMKRQLLSVERLTVLADACTGRESCEGCVIGERCPEFCKGAGDVPHEIIDKAFQALIRASEIVKEE